MSLTLTVQVSDEEERELEVTWYKIQPADKGGRYSPPCPAQLEDLEVVWADTKKNLSSEEWDKSVEPNWDEIEDMVCEYDSSSGERRS